MTYVCTCELCVNGPIPCASLLVDVNKQLEPKFARRPIPELVHRAELPRRIDVQQRKRRLPGIEGLDGQVQHH